MRIPSKLYVTLLTFCHHQCTTILTKNLINATINATLVFGINPLFGRFIMNHRFIRCGCHIFKRQAVHPANDLFAINLQKGGVQPKLNAPSFLITKFSFAV